MKVSAKSFVVFLNAAGRSKVGAVAKCMEPYKVEQDFYKRLREALDQCTEVQSFSELPTSVDLTPNASKRKHFGILLSSLQHFFDCQDTVALPFARRSWNTGQLEVSIAATTRMLVNGRSCTLMFWFAAKEPNQAEIEYFCALLELTYRSAYPDDVFGVLDIRKGQIRGASNDPWLEQFISAESIAFQSIWDALDKQL